MNVIVFLLIAGAASARHVLDAQLNNHDIGGVVIDRRNSEYISQNPESTPYINRKTEKTNQRFVQPTWKYIKQKEEEPLNNFRNDENHHSLRTNAHAIKAYSTTEYIMQGDNVYTNKKESSNIVERNLANQGLITGHVYQLGTQNGGFIKSDMPRSRTENRPSINYNQGNRRPETNIPLKYPQNERTLNVTNHKKEPVKQEAVLIQPIPTEETKGVERLPKTNTDKQVWVWGTEKPNVMNTEPDALDDRAAFTGDRCSSGFAKVMGMCVEKD